MKEQETSKDVTFKPTVDMQVLSSQHKQQTEDNQQQLSQIVGVSYQGDQVAASSTYEQALNEDSYSQEAGDYEGEQNETEYYEEFETSVVQPEEQVQVEIVGVEVSSILTYLIGLKYICYKFSCVLNFASFCEQPKSTKNIMGL